MHLLELGQILCARSRCEIELLGDWLNVLKLAVSAYEKRKNHENCIIETTKVSKQFQKSISFATNNIFAIWKLDLDLRIEEREVL